ncbi:hypothetical protein FLWE109334_14665 [Flavobacterium weaverense]|uniref:Uncharacterized protein n=1 Tax=Flavobacterium weaverense TaxID=271156 RepID=A0A3L9ZRS2_9FLAO|nr:hypothetical protein BC961_2731 [Flavobacterium weaverense]
MIYNINSNKTNLIELSQIKDFNLIIKSEGRLNLEDEIY